MRLVCMQSVCNNGLKQKVLDFYKREILQVTVRVLTLQVSFKEASVMLGTRLSEECGSFRPSGWVLKKHELFLVWFAKNKLQCVSAWGKKWWHVAWQRNVFTLWTQLMDLYKVFFEIYFYHTSQCENIANRWTVECIVSILKIIFAIHLNHALFTALFTVVLIEERLHLFIFLN